MSGAALSGADMSRSLALAFLSAAAVSAAAPAAQAATILSLGPDALCDPSGCFSDKVRALTRTFRASDFQGSTSIAALALDRSVLGAMERYAVRITFEDAAGNTVGNWGAWTVAVLGGQIVTLGGQPLAWDASMGDLTLKLELLVRDRQLGGGENWFMAGGGPAAFGGDGGGGGGGGAIPDGGAIASPPSLPISVPLPPDDPVSANLPQVLAVPEPASWALMLLGFMGAGTMLRRRRAPLAV